MHRPRYTFMQWVPYKFEFCVRQPGASPPPLLSRQRIPRINKIEQIPVDPRPKQFLTCVKQYPKAAASLLDQWTEAMDVNLLEEYASVLMQHNIPVSDSISQKLRKYGLTLPSRYHDTLLDRIEMPTTRSPLHLLMDKKTDPYVLQHWLNNSRNISSDLETLRTDWAQQLKNTRIPKYQDPQFDLLAANLGWSYQCELVADYMAAFTTHCLHSRFPRSLSGLCQNLANLLEHNMLHQVAKKHGITFFHRKSSFVWGLLDASPFTQKQLICLGSEWIRLVTNTCKFQQIHNSDTFLRPAFWKTWFVNRTQRRGVLVVNGFLLNQLRESKKTAELATNDVLSTERLHITPQQLPMVTPPRPWTSVNPPTTDHTFRELKLIASQSDEGKATVSESIRTAACLEHLRGLNRLQQQAWRVNIPLLKLIKQMAVHRIHETMRSKDDPVKIKDIQGESGTSPNNDAAIAIADLMDDRKFWLPMYMDFRGRCYTSHKVLLNFMSNDCIRSLFLFADAKPLGSSGLKWLQIHLCNLYGECKSASFAERIAWVKANEDNIRQSAFKALDVDWWTQSSKPFQTLAACLELQKAWDSPDPELYESSLPIQLDGTSNGLQHLVALARDEKVSSSVNLQQGECQDVYSAVSCAMKSNITREKIKQAVMTHFYGASIYSLNELFKRDGDTTIDDDPDLITKFATAMKQMFHRELAIQNWLTDCARRICNSHIASQSFKGASLVWTSPLGVPVVQPYVQTQYMAIRTELQSFWVSSPYHQPSIEYHKQCTSVHANFIHTLDAAHLVKTVNSMPSHASFAAIHDSFWTHPSTVDIMNTKLRQAFADLHAPDLLNLLRQEWLVRYGHYKSLATVHSDSPLYEKLVWMRDGVTTGSKLKEYLDKELVQLYNQTQSPTQRHQQDQTDKLISSPIQWINSKPVIGTPGLPYVKMWVPLDLPNVPEKGIYDPSEVKSAEYFFS